MTKYQSPRNKRRYVRNLVGKFRGGKLNPVCSEAVRPSEGGMLTQTVTMMLDPIPGKLITDMTAEFYMVFVPVQAIDAIKDPASAYAGFTDVIRDKFLSGTPLFGLENENEISKRCGIRPRSIGGVKKVNEAIRLAHNAAVNHLRVQKYVNAAMLLHTNAAVTPAILGQTVLDRLNAVLDPEDRVNGMVSFTLPSVELPVEGIGLVGNSGERGAGLAVRGVTAAQDWTSTTSPGAGATHMPVRGDSAGGSDQGFAIRQTGDGATARPDINAIFSDVQSDGVSLTDFYNAERMDRLVREMRLIIDQNPEYGEEMVINWAHGVSVVPGSTPWVIAERKQAFFKGIKSATDTAGVETDVKRTDGVVEIEVSALIPKTELGGWVITFCVLKPDETLSSQPDPIQSDVWTADNFVADELKIDPVPVTYRDVYSEVAAGDEALISCYAGFGHLRNTYVDYGFNRQVDPATVDNQAAVWQLNIPMSVSPESVLYPAYLDHGVFAFGGTEASPTEVCTYNIFSQLNFATPAILGPTPIEELAMIETADLFEDA